MGTLPPLFCITATMSSRGITSESIFPVDPRERGPLPISIKGDPPLQKKRRGCLPPLHLKKV